MAFTSEIFVLFALVFFPVFWILERFDRNYAVIFCALSSFLAVAFNFPLFALIPLYQTLLIVLYCASRKTPFSLGLTITLLVMPLLLFKYTEFFVRQFYGCFIFDIGLPLGISFYTFTAIGYVVDIYKDKSLQPPKSTFFKTLNLLTYWPHLAAGPILRAENMRVENGKSGLLQRDWYTASVLIVCRLYKKVVIADGVAALIGYNLKAGIGSMNNLDALATVVGFSIRIYGDFSGYSDMAIGFALLMGIRLPANFNYPYESKSLTEFWRRWHTSLSFWFRDYLYIPLGGNRHSLLVTSLIILFVFFISGLWHGASWGFIIWSLIHGLFLVAEKIGRHYDLHLNDVSAYIITVTVVTLSWAFFFLNPHEAILILSKIFAGKPSYLSYHTFSIFFYAFLVFLEFTIKPYRVVNGFPQATRSGLVLTPLFLTVCFYFAGKGLPFIYFDF